MTRQQIVQRAVALPFVLALAALPVQGQQQQVSGGRQLSLQQALGLAEETSEQVQIARAGVRRADGEKYRARSQYLPQLTGSVTYIRTLASEFSVLNDDDDDVIVPPPEQCNFAPNPANPLATRVDSLEAAVLCLQDENPFGNIFADLPFGRVNQLTGGLALSQTVFSGGRVQAQNRIADAGRRTADIDLASARAQIVLDVTRAYYDAALSDQLLVIAEATMAQAETTLSQVRLARQVGDQPEFELLRAQVTRDNQRPIVIQSRATRDLAHLRLKQLLNLRLDEPLTLSTALVSNDLPAVAVSATAPDTSTSARAPVRQANEALRVQESAVSIAKSQRWPSLILASQYGRVGYPEGGLPTFSQFRTNWTITALVDFPIYTGGRIKGDVMVAQAEAEQARARLQQTRELAALDTRDALEQLQAAQASWEASAGVVEQATKAYSIAEIRFTSGISTQLELNDSRILLQQAQANRAVAARDLLVARVRMTLLPDLPLGAGAATPGFSLQNPGLTPSTPPQQQTVPRGVQPGGRMIPVQASRVSN